MKDLVAEQTQMKFILSRFHFHLSFAGPSSAVGSASDSSARGSGFDNRSGHTFSFLLLLFQEGQLLVSGKSMCIKYWLTARSRNSVVRLTCFPDMTIPVNYEL